MVSISSHFSTLATDPLRNFKFLVEINHTVPNGGGTLAYMGFTSVSGLSVTTESIPYRQGSFNTTVHQIPGQTTFTPITMQRGMLLGTPMPWNWMKELFSVIAGNGNRTAKDSTFRCNLAIKVLDHPVTANVKPTDGTKIDANSVTVPIKMKFKVYNAWISTLSYSDLNAGDNALIVEQMTLVHEGFEQDLAGTKAGETLPD